MREGYKQTEVGEIPEDWDVKTLSEICKQITDGTHYTPRYVDSGVPFFSVENITANDFVNTKFITPEEHRKLIKRCKPERGDILMTRITAGIVGDTKLIDWEVDASIYVSLALLKLNDSILPTYFYAYTKSNQFLKSVEKRALVNATPKKINMDSIGAIPVPVPTSKVEQNEIADALLTINQLVSSLEELIAKKRDIKTATMQQLLTGKKRLPGFGEGKGYKQTELGEIPHDWDEVLLGEFSTKVGSGITPTGGSNVYKESGRPFVRSQNIGWGSLKLADLAFIDESTHSTFSTSEIQQGDVLLNITGASIGRCSIASKRLKGGNVNQHVCIIRMNNEISHEFLCYVLLSSIGQKQIESFQAGGNREGLNFGQIRSFLFPKPKTLSEQIEIAKVLSDLDGDISVWEGRLNKTKAIKQGMMQELLTGRTRLVDVGEVEQKQQKHGT